MEGGSLLPRFLMDPVGPRARSPLPLVLSRCHKLELSGWQYPEGAPVSNTSVGRARSWGLLVDEGPQGCEVTRARPTQASGEEELLPQVTLRSCSKDWWSRADVVLGNLLQALRRAWSRCSPEVLGRALGVQDGPVLPRLHLPALPAISSTILRFIPSIHPRIHSQDPAPEYILKIHTQDPAPHLSPRSIPGSAPVICLQDPHQGSISKIHPQGPFPDPSPSSLSLLLHWQGPRGGPPRAPAPGSLWDPGGIPVGSPWLFPGPPCPHSRVPPATPVASCLSPWKPCPGRLGNAEQGQPP